VPFDAQGEADNEMLRAAEREMPGVAVNSIVDGPRAGVDAPPRSSQMMIVKRTYE